MPPERWGHPHPGRGLLEDVFDFFAGLFEVAFGLIGLALGLEFIVIGGPTGGLFALALEFFGLA